MTIYSTTYTVSVGVKKDLNTGHSDSWTHNPFSPEAEAPNENQPQVAGQTGSAHEAARRDDDVRHVRENLLESYQLGLAACENFQTSLIEDSTAKETVGLPLPKRAPRRSLVCAAGSGLVKLR